MKQFKYFHLIYRFLKIYSKINLWFRISFCFNLMHSSQIHHLEIVAFSLRILFSSSIQLSHMRINPFHADNYSFILNKTLALCINLCQDLPIHFYSSLVETLPPQFFIIAPFILM